MSSLSKQWSRFSSQWRLRYRPWFSVAVMVVGTILIAASVYAVAPWSPYTTWIFVAMLGLLSWFSPLLGIVVGLLLLAPILAATSVWLAVIQSIIAVSFLIAGGSHVHQKHTGFWLPLVLMAPWSAAHGLVFLPLFLAIALYGRQSYLFTLFLGLQTAFWAALQGSLPGFNFGLALTAPAPVAHLTDWVKLQFQQFSTHSFGGDLGGWLEANLGVGMLLAIIMLLTAVAMVWIRTVGSLAPGVRSALSWPAGVLLGTLGLIYMGRGPLGWAGLWVPLQVAAGSALLAWLAARFLEAPPKALLQMKESQARTHWSDIAGYADVKQEILEAVEPYVDPKVRARLNRLNLPATKGMLLYGPPGVGKTMFARAVASETGMKFISVAGPEFICTWVGESERRLRALFQEAKESAPCIIFFDEIESFLQPRNSANSSNVDMNQRVVATFLSHMDGFDPLEGVLVIGATNRPDQIDPAAIRSGRFDKIILIPHPDPEARREIWQHFLAGRPGAKDIDLDALVVATERHTGADIKGLVNECYRSTGGEVVTTKEILRLIEQTKPSVTLSMLETYEELNRKFGRRSQMQERAPLRESAHLTWNDIAGMDSVREELREVVELPMLRPELFEQYKLRPARGVLLYGPPGCGKTLFARVLASETKATFLSVNGPELLHSYVGESEQGVRNLFREARENRPAIVFIDEIDSLASRRHEGPSGLHVVNQLLTEMDGLHELNGVVVLAATNRPEVLDPAVLRPGRFDRLVYVGLPDAASRRAQLAHHLQNRPAVVNLDELVGLTEGCTGAELAHAVNEATMSVVREAMNGKSRPITTADLRQVITRMPRSVSKAERLNYDLVGGMQR